MKGNDKAIRLQSELERPKAVVRSDFANFLKAAIHDLGVPVVLIRVTLLFAFLLMR